MKQESRRVRMTRKLLNDSLLECLQHKLLDKVTVTEICRRADVNQISGVQFWEKLSIPATYFLQGLGSEQEEAEIERSTFAFSGIYALLFRWVSQEKPADRSMLEQNITHMLRALYQAAD